MGEDWHILLPVGGPQISFKPSLGPAGREVQMMKEGNVIHPRVKLSQAVSHVILENVGESDEGLYIINSMLKPKDVKQINLIVRGDTQHSVIK